MPDVFAGMAEVTRAVSYIAKKRSQGVSYEFRGIDDVMNHLHGPLADNGLFLSPRVLDDWQVNMIPGSPDNKGNPRAQAQALFRICIDVYAEDGSMVTLGPGLAQSHDYGDKAVYQAQQNAIKYLLLEAFAIPTAEVDMDARTPDPVSDEPPMFELGAWAKNAVAMFKEWEKPRQEKEWVEAIGDVLGGRQPANADEGRQVVEAMSKLYYVEHPPAEDEAPF
jgi:hypothetical protein